MTLNEADVLGLRLEPSGAWCDLLLHVVALIRVDLQEHVADAQRHALRVRDSDFDLRTSSIIAEGRRRRKEY